MHTKRYHISTMLLFIMEDCRLTYNWHTAAVSAQQGLRCRQSIYGNNWETSNNQ